MKSLKDFIDSEESELKSQFLIPSIDIVNSFIENDKYLERIYNSNPKIVLNGINLKELIESEQYIDYLFYFHLDQDWNSESSYRSHSTMKKIKKDIKFIREQFYIDKKSEFDKFENWIGDFQSLYSKNHFLFIALYNKIYHDTILNQFSKTNIDPKIFLRKIYFAYFNQKNSSRLCLGVFVSK